MVKPNSSCKESLHQSISSDFHQLLTVETAMADQAPDQAPLRSEVVKKHVLWDYEYTLFEPGEEPYQAWHIECCGMLDLLDDVCNVSIYVYISYII